MMQAKFHWDTLLLRHVLLLIVNYISRLIIVFLNVQFSAQKIIVKSTE